jgi:hypothetical protein
MASDATSGPGRFGCGPPATTCCLKTCPLVVDRYPCVLCCIFRPFCLQPPLAVPMRYLVFSAIGLTGGRIVPDAPRPRGPCVLGFATSQQARHGNRPNRVCGDRHESVDTADWTFASGCSPPRLAATQLPSATRNQTFPDEDFHLANATTLQAHWHGSPEPCGRGRSRST